MESLNDIIRWHVENVVNTNPYMQKANLKAGLDLDPDMPSIYSGWLSSEGVPEYISRMLEELKVEYTDLLIGGKGFTKLRYGTLFLDNTQVIIIDHNGSHIPYETLSVLNKKLDRVVETGFAPYGRGGNQRAASYIQPYGGRISIENRDGEYKVSTTVILSLKA